MNTKTLTEIDFFRIRDQVASYCLSEAAKASLLDREPFKKSLEGEHFEAVINMIDRKEVSVTTDNGISGTIPFRDVFGDTFFFY